MQYAAKGHSENDGTYHYCCGKCKGTGRADGTVCNWCYAGDFEAVREALKSGVRGQQYYSLLKEFLRIAGKDIVSEARDVKKGDEKLTPAGIGYLSLRFGLNLKALWEWLEECQVVYSGTYSRFTESGLKVRDLYAAAHMRWENIEQWTVEEVE